MYIFRSRKTNLVVYSIFILSLNTSCYGSFNQGELIIDDNKQQTLKNVKIIVLNGKVFNFDNILEAFKTGHVRLDGPKDFSNLNWASLFKNRFVDALNLSRNCGLNTVSIPLRNCPNYGYGNFLKMWMRDADVFVKGLSDYISYLQSIEREKIEARLEGESKTRQYLEALKVDDLAIEGSAPTPGSLVIRRSWDNYTKSNKKRRIILFSGREGFHSKTFGTTQGLNNYLIDICWEEVKPDAVLDVKNKDHTMYIPSRAVDEIVADDARFLPNEIIPEFLRMLKSGGILVFKPGSGMGWPALDPVSYLKKIEIDESGRFARASSDILNKMTNDKEIRDDFIRKAVRQANYYFISMGFSRVEYNTEHQVFVLIK